MADGKKYGAGGDAAHRLPAPLGGVEERALNLVPVDHPDRSSTFPTIPVRPIYLRVDHQHDLPIVALDGLARPAARFRHLADAAHFLNHDLSQLPTLPYSIVIAARREDGEQLCLL